MIITLKNQALVADQCEVADSFFDRLKGLIGRRGLAPGQGMLFRRCNNVHMWFMRFSIDVVFLRTEKGEDGITKWKVSSVHENVPPWRPLPVWDWRGMDTLELPQGTVRRCAIRVGDELCSS